MNNNVVIEPTERDVLNGRGQGVQRHGGNVKYRKLVFVNKGLYAKCPRSDKIKISKGIVAAIRQSGGRFLEHNERQDFYFDIGDKKATEKTSQALREGQKDIRKKMYQSDDAAMAHSTASQETNKASNVTMPPEPDVHGDSLPPEDYFQYSLLVLEALYNSDPSSPHPPSRAPAPRAVNQQPVPSLPPPLVPAQNVGMYGVPQNAYLGPSSAAMAMALDQFPGATMPAQPMPQAGQQQQYHPRMQFSLGAELSDPSFRLTDMSLGSVFSIRQLVESCRNTGAQPPNGNRGTLDSRLSSGTMEMIRQSQYQLNQIDQMELDELQASPGEIDALFDRNTLGSGGESFSDMRFSDLSKDRFTEFQDKSRLTDCSQSTKNTTSSGHSLMTGDSEHAVSSTDSDMAQLLLGLANNDGGKDNRKSENMDV
jgi:hypothetical protein